MGEITVQGENIIQQAWKEYAKQFVTFAATRYPKIPGYKWEIWLAKKRIKQLNAYFSGLHSRKAIMKDQYGL